MPSRAWYQLAVVQIFFLCSQLMAQTRGEVATVPSIPEAGREFHVAHLRDVAELHLGNKPPEGIKYQWTVTVMDGKRKVGLEAAGFTLPLADAPSVKVKRARPFSEYRFTLSKTIAGKEQVYRTLVVNFEREGAAAEVSKVIPVLPVEPVPAPAAVEPPTAPGATDPFAPEAAPPPAPADTDPFAPPAPPRRRADSVPLETGADPVRGTRTDSGDAASRPEDHSAERARPSDPTREDADAEALEDASRDVDPFSNAGLAKTRQEALDFIAKKVPKTDPVLSPPEYFINKFSKLYQTTGGKFTLAGTKAKLLACMEVARAMDEIGSQEGNPVPTPQSLLADWTVREGILLSKLGEKSEATFDRSILTDNELQAWKQFLQEWREDVSRSNPERFKDALLQAAYQIVKAGLEIQTAQERAAASGELPARSSSNGDGSGNGIGGTSFPFHERRMNKIIHHYERRASRAALIRARR